MSHPRPRNPHLEVDILYCKPLVVFGLLSCTESEYSVQCSTIDAFWDKFPLEKPMPRVYSVEVFLDTLQKMSCHAKCAGLVPRHLSHTSHLRLYLN
jgi:hypothetical protein